MESQYVCCDGKNDRSSGHPKIYLALKKSEVIVCPYCGREFGKAGECDQKEGD